MHRLFAKEGQIMILLGEITEIKEQITELFPCFPDVTLNVKKSEEKGYEISESNGEYFINYRRKTDFFRGLSVLADKIKKCEKDFTFSEKNNFDYCGIMADVSRNAVLKVETVKDIIRYMAKMGLNQLMLYTEDTYKLDKYPYFGYMRGAYTKDEIKEIVAYGNKYGVTTVPCIQTLGHLKRALQWGYASGMKDTDEILLVGEDSTYEFIEEMIKTSRECYDTDMIHIGMDEVEKLGSGAYKKKHGEEKRFDILTKHLSRVMEIVEKYGFKAMMWSDMFFKLGSPDGEYYTYNAKMPDNISDIIPKNLSMVYWDYYNNNPKVSDCMIASHKTMGRECVFAGGIWTWCGLSPNYDKTFVTTRAALNNCIKHGVQNVFATMWGDDGAECSIYAALLGMQLFAEYNYSDNPDDAQVSQMFKACTGCDMDAFISLSLDTLPEDVCPSHLAMPAKQIFYNDIMLGLWDKNFRLYDYKAHFTNALEKLENTDNQGKFEYLFDYYRLFAKVLSSKCDIGIRLYDAYNAHDGIVLSSLENELYTLWQNLEKMHTMLFDIWHKNNKPFGFEVFDARFGGVCARAKHAYMRVKAYLDGTIESLPEFEEERLYYARSGNGESAFSWEYNSARIFSASM